MTSPWRSRLRMLIAASACIQLFSPSNCADERWGGMDQYVNQALRRWQVPGLAIAIVKDGEVVLARGYGLCEVGSGREVTPRTPFHLASCEKSFVAAAVALLIEEGKLRWDDPVIKHLPEFELIDRYLTDHVTIRDLLCHRTGLRRADLLADGADRDPQVVMSRLKYLEPVAELRTRYVYNNHMYTVLGELVKRVSGQPLQQFITTRLLQPLGMESTTTSVSSFDVTEVARRHWRSDEGIVSRPIDEGMYSTVLDMAKWLKFQLAEGTYDGRQLLKPDTIREMHAQQFSMPIRSRSKSNVYAARFLGSGLGWSVQDYRGHKVVSMAGSWGAMVAMIPEERLGVVVLSNLDLEYLCALLMYDVFDAYLVGAEMVWNPDKWEANWLRNEPPGAVYRPRNEAQARLVASRTKGTVPTWPLENYAGDYDSQLYGRLRVRINNGQLTVTFHTYTTDSSHWQDDSFYVRAPTRLTFDWLLTFVANEKGKVTSVIVKHVGWDQDEKDHRFVRSRAD